MHEVRRNDFADYSGGNWRPLHAVSEYEAYSNRHC